MLLQRRQTAVGVGDQPHPHAGGAQRPQRRLHVVVQREMAAGRPFVVDLASARLDGRAGGAHLLQHAAGEPDEQLRAVRAAAGALELDRRGGHGRRVAGRVDRQTVAAGKAPVSLGFEPSAPGRSTCSRRRRRRRSPGRDRKARPERACGPACRGLYRSAAGRRPEAGTGCHYNGRIGMSDWKQTLNLPRTGFPMKAGLQEAEPQAIARWEETGLYERIRMQSAGRAALRASRRPAVCQRPHPTSARRSTRY